MALAALLDLVSRRDKNVLAHDEEILATGSFPPEGRGTSLAPRSVGVDNVESDNTWSVPRSRRLIQQDIPNLGTVALKPASIDNVLEAHEVAAKSEEAVRPAAFANSLLASILVAPEMSPEVVGGLQDPVATILVEMAADVLNIRQEFDGVPADRPSRERLYTAHRQYERAQVGQLKASIEGSLGASLEQVYGSAAEMVRQLDLPQGRVKEIVDASRQMSAINTAITSLSSSPEIVRAAEEMRKFQESLKQGTQPIRKMIEDLGRIKLPEPFLSDILISSGLNSAILHSPTYPLPAVAPVRSKQEILARARDVERRRLLDAYDIISTLEQAVRELIEAKLREAHGNQWWKHGVPEAVRTGCEKRKQEKEGPFEASYHPIYYAYVGDYRTVITKRDNWDTSFAAIFGNKAELEVSMNRIGRVRDPVAHSRPISDEDYQLLVAEAKWLTVRIGRFSQRGASSC
jgi:hypothetical protein